MLQRTEAALGKQLEEHKEFDKDKALVLEESVAEASRIAGIEIRAQAKGGKADEDGDNPESNPDLKLFGKKRSHGQAFKSGMRSFAKKRTRK